VTPNQRATVNVVIVNQGDAAERYTLDVDGVAPAWVQLPSALMIGAGEQVIATIGVVVPLESTSLAQIYPITVRLLAGGGQLASRAMMEWDVQPFVDGQLVIEPKRVVNRRSAAFSVALSNLGNTAARFAIGVDEDAPDLQATLETSLVQVGPGETVTLPLKVTAPARWIGAERRHGFTVKASYAQQRPFTVAGMLVQPPMISTWLLIGLILMLLIIAALAVRLIGIAG
jgi:uncharacterized membrane protein